MNWLEKFNFIVVYVWWGNLKSALRRIKRQAWNRRLLLWWYRLWIREDEFHRSLSIDYDAMLVMDRKERNKYFTNLNMRRHPAHQKDWTKL